MNNKILFIGDCIINHLQIENEPSEICYVHYRKYKTVDIDLYDIIIIHVNYCNHISVLERKEDIERKHKQYTELYDNVLKGKSKNILILDRPGALTRYIDRGFRQTIDPNPEELGLSVKEAYSNGWQPQSLSEQLSRRHTWRERLVSELHEDIHYYDLNQYISHEQAMLWSSELNHKSRIVRDTGGVVGEAPWHYKKQYTIAINEIVKRYIDKKTLTRSDIYNILNP